MAMGTFTQCFHKPLPPPSDLFLHHNTVLQPFWEQIKPDQ